jgi:exopolysaccharide biosynthesis polyprenyl glycosylphosphotransferase
MPDPSPPSALPPAPAAVPPPGGAAPGTLTIHRVGLDAAQRRIWTPAHERSTRQMVAVALFLIDLAVCVGPLLLRPGPWRRFEVLTSLPSLAALVACCWLGLYLIGAYRLRELVRGIPTGLVAFAGCVGALAGLVAYKLLVTTAQGSEPVLRFTGFAFAAVLLFGAWAAVSRVLATRWLRRREAAARLLLLGSPEHAQALTATLAAAGSRPPLVVFHEPVRDGTLPLASLDEHLAGHVRAVVLAVALPDLPAAAIPALIHARLADVPVLGASQVVEQICERTPVMLDDHAWMLQEDSINPGRSPLYAGAKRLLDVVAALVGLTLSAPLLLGTAIAVKLTSPGPVFFTQVREGRWKQPFRIVKFRTMRTDAEQAGAQWASRNDPRVTPIGAFLRKSRFDELPQFWNVLVGEMSLVGPRPERPEFNQMLVERIPWYDLRHLAKPGLTGWAQVCYSYGASVEDAIAKLEYEIYWMKHASLRFDLRIILRTIAVVVGLRGR